MSSPSKLSVPYFTWHTLYWATYRKNYKSMGSAFQEIFCCIKHTDTSLADRAHAQADTSQTNTWMDHAGGGESYGVKVNVFGN